MSEYIRIRNSSAIEGIEMIGPDLRVYFKSGNCFEYEGVGVDLMEQMLKAESPGRFYGKEIRGKFQGRAITGDDDPEAA